jgi:hypothetical protein
MRSTLRERAAGQGTMAAQNYAQQRAASAGAASGTAARLADRGAASPALAGRLAAQQEASMNAAAGAQFAQQQTAERQRAESQLADMRAQRQGFFRNMLGAGLQTAANVTTMMGMRPGGFLNADGSRTPGGLPTSGMVMGPFGPVPAGTPTGQGVNAGNGGNAGGIGDGLLLRQGAPLLGAAVGGPMGAAVGQQVGQGLANAFGGDASTMGLVDQALAASPPGAAPVTAPQSMTDTSGLTDDEFLQWLMTRGGR